MVMLSIIKGSHTYISLNKQEQTCLQWSAKLSRFLDSLQLSEAAVCRFSLCLFLEERLHQIFEFTEWKQISSQPCNIMQHKGNQMDEGMCLVQISVFTTFKLYFSTTVETIIMLLCLVVVNKRCIEAISMPDTTQFLVPPLDHRRNSSAS